MRLSIDEKQFLIERREELQREIRELKRTRQGPCYHEMNDRRVELLDELNRVEAELEAARVE